MGVPSLYRRLFVKYRKEILSETHPSGSPVEYLYIDYNCGIHPAVKQPGLKLEDMHDAAIAYLDKIVRAVGPNKMVCVCIDGSAPRGKMLQQRKRRINLESDMIEAVRRKYGKHRVAREGGDVDFNMISPGTEFMTVMNQRVHKYLAKIGPELGIQCLFSGSDVPGEGEHKIMADIRANRSGCDAVAIYGLDSDLIILSMMSKIPGIVLFREVIEFGKGAETIHGKFVYMSIDRLRESMYLEVVDRLTVTDLMTSRELFGETAAGDGGEEKIDTVDQDRTIDDLRFLTFFLGNDFVPSLVDLRIRDSGMENITDAYCAVRVGREDYLVDVSTGEINSDFLRAIFRVLETEMTMRISKKRERSRFRVKRLLGSDEYQCADPMNRELMKLGCPELTDTLGMIECSRRDWKRKYYENYFVRKIHLKQTAREYLKTIFWMFKYYTSGCPSWDWVYKYYGAPLVCDIHAWLRDHDINAMNFKLGAPATAEEQLLYIMPRKSVMLLPERLRRLITDPRSPLGPMYPETHRPFSVGKTYHWEFEPIFQVPDMKTIRSAIFNISNSTCG